MTLQSDNRPGSFATEIGWKADILSRASSVSDEWLPRLRELQDLFGRAVVWTSDAVGTIEYRENGEKWLAEFKTHIDGQRIWRLYERVHPHSERPRFRIARSDTDLIWEDMGYFDVWPDGWKMQLGANSMLRRIVTASSSI